MNLRVYLFGFLVLASNAKLSAQQMLQSSVSVNSEESAQCSDSKVTTVGPVRVNCVNQNLSFGVIGSAVALANYNDLRVDTKIAVASEQGGGGIQPTAIAGASFGDGLQAIASGATYLRMYVGLKGAEYIAAEQIQSVQLNATNGMNQSQVCSIARVYKTCSLMIALQGGTIVTLNMSLNVQISFGSAENPPMPAMFQYLSAAISKVEVLDANLNIIPNAMLTSFSGTVYPQ